MHIYRDTSGSLEEGLKRHLLSSTEQCEWQNPYDYEVLRNKIIKDPSKVQAFNFGVELNSLKFDSHTYVMLVV